MTYEFIKRKYYDFRQGGIILAPVLGLSNFMMLAYLTISEVIPLWIFAPVFIITVLFGFTFMGNQFRKIQFSTDLDLGFERAKSQGETLYQIMKSQKQIMDKLQITYPSDYITRMDFMKRVSKGI